MSTEMDEQVDDLDEEIKELKAENADLKAKLESYHAERQELRSVLLPADCDWEHHPSLIQCAKDLKAKLERLTTDYRNLAETYRHDTGELREKLEATLPVQFDAAAFEKVRRERDAMREGLDGTIAELTRLLDVTGEADHEPIHNEIARLQTLRGGTSDNPDCPTLDKADIDEMMKGESE